MAKPSTSKPLKAAARPRRFLPSRRGCAARGEEVADINPPYKWQNLPRHYRELFTFGTPVTKPPSGPPVTPVTADKALIPRAGSLTRAGYRAFMIQMRVSLDRKSTRLNSSHVAI